MPSVIALAALAVPATAAQGQADHELDGEALVRTSVVAGVDAVGPDDRFELAIRFRMEPGWHIYWRNAGGSGMPTEIDLTLPEGFGRGETLWPVPKVFPGSEPSYGYDGEVVLLIPITAPATLAGDSVPITVDLSWLVCRKSCLFGAREHVLELPVSTRSGETPEAEHAELISTWRERMPLPLERCPEFRIRLDGDRLVAEGPAPGARSVRFIPESTPGVTPRRLDALEAPVVDGRFRLVVPLDVEPANALGEPLRVAGLIVPRTAPGAKGLPSVTFRLPVPIGSP